MSKKCSKLRKFFRRGAEMLEFAFILPLFASLMLLVVEIAQIALAHQKIEYVIYAAGRAAVVQDTEDAARTAAQQIVNKSFPSGNSVYIVDGEHAISINFDTNESGGTPDQWMKGNFIKVTLSIKLQPVLGPQLPMSSTISMMIENGGTEN